MSYNTNFSLAISGGPENVALACGAVNLLSNVEPKSQLYEDPDWLTELIIEGSNSAKWYEHKKDMTLISKSCPGVLFTIEGEGEDVDDHWFEYWQNGKHQECVGVMTFPPFDHSKMK